MRLNHSLYKVASASIVCFSLALAPAATAQSYLSSSSTPTVEQDSDIVNDGGLELIPTDIEIGGVNQIVRFDIENGAFEESSNGDIVIKNDKGKNVGGMSAGDKNFANGGIVNISFELLNDSAVLVHSEIVQGGISSHGMGPSCFGNIVATTAATGLLFTSATPATVWGMGLALTAWTGQYMNTVAACAG